MYQVLERVVLEGGEGGKIVSRIDCTEGGAKLTESSWSWFRVEEEEEEEGGKERLVGTGRATT